MRKKDLQKKIILKAEEYLKIKIVDIKTPPQGMDSQVFFIVDSNNKEYAIKYYERGLSGDILTLKLLKEQRINIHVPEVLGVFTFENRQVAILEKINFPLLNSMPTDQMYRYIPSMIKNLKKIHQITSDKPGFLTEADKNRNWKEIVLSKFTGEDPNLNWNSIALRKGLDAKLILQSVKNIIKKIEKINFIDKSYSLLHTDFNQRNLFVDPNSDEIAAIIDWGEAMFGDPIYDFARVRMYIWHFNLENNTLDNYYKILTFTPEQRQLEELYWLSRIIEYLAYYSEKLNKFNMGRIRLHLNYLEKYKW